MPLSLAFCLCLLAQQQKARSSPIQCGVTYWLVFNGMGRRSGWEDLITFGLRRPAVDTTSAFRQASGFHSVVYRKGTHLRRCAAFTWRPFPSFVGLERHLLGFVQRKISVIKVAIDGVVQEAQPDEFLIDLISRAGGTVPHVCYHPQLGPVQTC